MAAQKRLSWEYNQQAQLGVYTGFRYRYGSEVLLAAPRHAGTGGGVIPVVSSVRSVWRSSVGRHWVGAQNQP